MTDTPKVYAAIAAVQADFSKMGLEKSEKNEFQRYNFRGIDSLMVALSPLLARHDLIILPMGANHYGEEREAKDGKASFRVVVSMVYLLIHKGDASTIQVGPFYGEATDTSDKATNKAMSAAYKYMAFQTFCIPIKGQDEGDKDHNEVASKAKPQPTPPKDTRSKADIDRQVNSIGDLMVEIEAHDEGLAAIREIFSDKPYNGLDVKGMSRKMALGFHRDLTTVLSHLEEKKNKEKK